jgi:hypothetical protein
MPRFSIQLAPYGKVMDRLAAPLLFRETQSFRQTRLRVVTAIPPVGMLVVLIWQVVLGHPLGKTPLSNASVIGWTIFLFIIYIRLVTVRLVTEVAPGQVLIKLSGLWRSTRIYLTTVRLVDIVTFDPIRDWGGFGIRSNKDGRAYIAGGTHGVQLTFADGEKALIESQTPGKLASSIREAVRQSN